LGDYAIFAGGSDDQGNISAQVDLFRGSTQQWSTATLSVPRWGLAAASLNSTQAALFGGDSGLALFAGGFLDTFITPPTNYSALVDVFDPTSGTWFTTTLSQKRGDIASASLGDLAVFAGGWNPSADSRVVDIFVPSASPSPIYLVSNTSQLYYTPVLRLNSGSAQVILVPKDNSGLESVCTLGITLESLLEMDGQSVVQQVGSPENGGWTVVSGNPLGSVESFLHSASLMVNATHGGTKSAHMDLQFYLFQQELTLTTDRASFTVSPRYAKFSLNISSWPWLSCNNTLEIRFSLSPKFANFTKQQDVNTTTFIILGQFANSEAQSHIQLIESVELDGVIHPTGAQFLLDAKSSELVLIFPYFNSSLSYDPYMGVLFGPSSTSGSSQLPLIVGTAVAGSVVIVTIAVIALVLLLLAKRRQSILENRLAAFILRQQPAKTIKAVNFGGL